MEYSLTRKGPCISHSFESCNSISYFLARINLVVASSFCWEEQGPLCGFCAMIMSRLFMELCLLTFYAQGLEPCMAKLELMVYWWLSVLQMSFWMLRWWNLHGELKTGRMMSIWQSHSKWSRTLYWKILWFILVALQTCKQNC